jgi:hypothetical protein
VNSTGSGGLNKGFTKLSPYKKDPRQKLSLPVMTVANRLKSKPKPPKPVGGGNGGY